MSNLFNYLYEKKGCDRADLLCGEKYGFVEAKSERYDILYESNFGCDCIKLYIGRVLLKDGIVCVNCLCRRGVIYNYQIGKIIRCYDVAYGKKFMVIYYNRERIDCFDDFVVICHNYIGHKIRSMDVKINISRHVNYICRDYGNGIFKYN